MLASLMTTANAYVAELSSFMLSYASPRSKRACITNITPNHLDWHSSFDEYCEAAAYAVARMPEDVVIHRLTGDCPKGMLVAPEWNSDKTIVIDRLMEKMQSLGYRQGSLANK